MTTELSAGWAVVSKPSGSYSEYSVVAASRTPYSPKQLGAVIRAVSPGNSPPVHEPQPVGLPWVWFTRVRAKDTGIQHLGIVIRDWTQETDAANRPIVANRFFCVPLREFFAAGYGFTDLYDAVADLAPPVAEADPCAGEEIVLRLPSSGNRSSNDNVPGILAHAAAALLDGSVTLVGGPVDVRARVAMLDAIARWLPAGAREWLTASAWTDVGASKGIALAFAGGARGSDLVVDLRAEAHSGREITMCAATYERALDALCRKHGNPAVVEHLAGLTGIGERNAETALRGLESLDLPSIALAEMAAGTIGPQRIQQLWSTGLFDGFSTSDQRTMLSQLLRSRGAGEFLACEEVLVAHRGLLDPNELSMKFLWILESGSSAEPFTLLTTLAECLDAIPAYVAALEQAEIGRTGIFAQRFPARELIALARDDSWAQELAGYVVRSRWASAEMAKVLCATGIQSNEQWLRMLDDTPGGDVAWRPVIDVFYRALEYRAPPASRADIELLWSRDRELIPALLAAGGSAISPGTLDVVLSAVAQIVFETSTGAGLSIRLVDSLRRAPLTNMRLVLLRDYLLWLGGTAPSTSGRLGDPAYRQAIIELHCQAEWSAPQANSFIKFVLTALGSGWESANPEPVLDMLWSLLHAPGIGASVDEMPILGAVAGAITQSQYSLLDIPKAAQWVSRLEDESILEPIVRIRIKLHEKLAENASEDVIAQHAVDLLKEGGTKEEMLGAFAHSRWEANPAKLLAVASGITARLPARSRDSGAGFDLVRSYFDGRVGYADRRFAQQLGLGAFKQIGLTVRVLSLAAAQLRGKPDAAAVKKVLTRVEDMAKPIFEPESDGHGGWLPWGKGASNSEIER